MLKEQAETEAKQTEAESKQTGENKPEEVTDGQKTIENSEDRGTMKIGIQFFAKKTLHADERIEQRNLPEIGVDDALSNPLYKGDVIVDEAGRKSVKYIGKDITVILNPDTGEVVTAWKTGTRIRRKYGGDR